MRQMEEIALSALGEHKEHGLLPKNSKLCRSPCRTGVLQSLNDQLNNPWSET